MKKIILSDKKDQIHEYWNPKILCELNEQHIMMAKLKGEFVWHTHAEEDELFYVLEGELELHFRTKVILLKKGEMYMIPKGVEHKPVAKEEVLVLLFEPKKTVNTGNVQNHLTKSTLDVI